VIFMAGQKFGTTDAPAATWMMNVVVPSICAERYAGSRIVAFSTGNVYALTPAPGAGSRETDAPAPIGEYANSCLGRERVFEFAAAEHRTRVAILRLNYAIDLRYGVLTDIALRVWRGEAVDVTMGWVNVIWQGAANRYAVRALEPAASTPWIANVAGPLLSVRAVASRFGELFERPARIVGTEAPDALLSDSTRLRTLLGDDAVPVDRMTRWIADWIRHGRPLLGKPTSYERRDGAF
jgi:hypothetical protein